MTNSSSSVVTLPSHKVSAALAAVHKAHEKLVKAAKKAGHDAPVAPTFTLTNTVEKDEETGLSYAFTEIAVTYAAPVVGEYEFVAVIEPLDGGNLVKNVPGCTVTLDLSSYRTGAIKCDHCNTIRKRTETFIVVETATGKVKQVGRNCLKDFLGGKSAAYILASFSFEKILGGFSEEGGGGGLPVFEPAHFLAWTAGSVRVKGWISKAAAMAAAESGRTLESTAAHVRYLLCGPTGPVMDLVRRAHKEAVLLCTPTGAETAKATLALEYAKGLTGATDYEANLKLVCSQEFVTDKHLGILASAFSAYERYIGESLKKADWSTQKLLSTHVGIVKDKLTVTVTVDKVFTVETQYGNLHINKLKDSEGNTLVWKTASTRFDIGKTLTLKGTVKAHSEFNGEKQTELTRCKEI